MAEPTKDEKERKRHLTKTKRRIMRFDVETFEEALARLRGISDEEWERAQAEDDHAS